MVKKSKEYIIKNYDLKKNEIESCFHYPPTTFLLHIHFNLINNNKKNRIPLLEHSVNSVIENLRIDPNYYKKIQIETLKEI